MAFVPSVLRYSAFTPHLVLKPLISSRRMRTTRTFMSQSPSSVPLPENPTVGFIGLGVMGFPMMVNLSKYFPDLIVWNRSGKHADIDAAIDKSATVHIAQSPADVVSKSHITFSMLSTPQAVRSVFYDHDSPALSTVTPDKCIVDCSTLQIEDMINMNRHVTERGGLFLEAPVSGSKVPAEQGQLIFLCGGSKPLFDHPVTQKALDLMGKKSFFLGTVGNGTKMKLVINQLMCTMLAALGESIVLAEALELPVPELLDILSLGAMNNPMFSLKGPKMKEGAKGYDTNFPLEHAQKDVTFALALGDNHGINMGIGGAAKDWYKAASQQGLARADFCAVIESIRASAGRQK